MLAADAVQDYPTARQLLEAAAHVVHDEGRTAQAVQLAKAASHLRTLRGTSSRATTERSRAAWLQAARATAADTPVVAVLGVALQPMAKAVASARAVRESSRSAVEKREHA